MPSFQGFDLLRVPYIFCMFPSCTLNFLPPLLIPDPLLCLWVLIFYFLLTNFIHKPFRLSLLNGKLRFSISPSCQLCSLHCSYRFIKFSFWILNCLHYFIRMFSCSFLDIIQVFIVIILEFIEVICSFILKVYDCSFQFCVVGII